MKKLAMIGCGGIGEEQTIQNIDKLRYMMGDNFEL